MFAFAQSLYPLNVDPTEVGLLSAISLICSGKRVLCKIIMPRASAKEEKTFMFNICPSFKSYASACVQV